MGVISLIAPGWEGELNAFWKNSANPTYETRLRHLRCILFCVCNIKLYTYSIDNLYIYTHSAAHVLHVFWSQVEATDVSFNEVVNPSAVMLSEEHAGTPNYTSIDPKQFSWHSCCCWVGQQKDQRTT